MLDTYQRNIDYLRISVTDQCNLRCVYCMPEYGVESLLKEEILTAEEILQVCKAATKLGICKIKITGGEPLVRTGIVELVRQIKKLEGIQQVTLTTNGVRLAEFAEPLQQVGLDGVNISLDSLNREKFQAITRRDKLDSVLQGLKMAWQVGIPSIKVNCLPVQEFNSTELVEFVDLARDRNICVRFIELMPIGMGKQFHPIPNREIFRQIQEKYGELTPVSKKLGNGPATYFHIEGFRGHIGFISAVSQEFCSTCNRIRLTSEGFLKLCLHYNKGVDLKVPLRSGITEDELVNLMSQAICIKPLHHHFGEEYFPDAERKTMAQIGG